MKRSLLLPGVVLVCGAAVAANVSKLSLNVDRRVKGRLRTSDRARKILSEYPALRGTVVPAELVAWVKLEGKKVVLLESGK